MISPRMTSIDVDGWTLDDGELAHAEAPETFWISSLADRTSLCPGDMVKMRFYIRVAGEDDTTWDEGGRMWVWVAGRLDDWYRGELDNQPTCTDDIGPGFQVWFSGEACYRHDSVRDHSRRSAPFYV